MTLNAQERAAVEAAKVKPSPWPTTAAHDRIARHFPRDSDLREFDFACGHLSGFRAGVVAALEIAVHDLGETSLSRKIRALLAQEDEHGS